MDKNADELPLITASIAYAFAKVLTTDELNSLGNFLISLGSDLLTIVEGRGEPM